MTQKQQNYSFALSVMIVLSFLLGFITTMNNSMIDFCTKAFSLDETQRQLVNTAFYGAYIFSVPIAWILGKIGYKRALVAGMAIVGLGFLLNVPGISFGYYGFLSCMFIVALGIVLLQVAINPYVLALGPVETAASRLTLNQTFNSLATTIAPVFVSMLIVSGGTYEASAIKAPFLGLGLFALVLGAIVLGLKLPAIQEQGESSERAASHKTSAFKYPHVWLGTLGIFVYMGVEIGIPSFFPARVEALGLNIAEPTKYLSLYWGGLLVGRALGAGVLTRFSARTILTSCCGISALCIVASLLTTGWVSIWLFIATGLFHSIMWSCIFSLASADLGPNTKQASGIICTGVIGAAILMPMMGSVQKTAGLTVAICFLFAYYLYLAWFARKGSQIRTQSK